MLKVAIVKDPAYYQIKEVKQKTTKKGLPDKERYFSEGDFSIGIWEGEGAKALGIYQQPIWHGELDRLQAGFHPKTGIKLFTVSKKKGSYEFVDATVSAIKDFTTLALIDTDLNADEMFERAFQATLKIVQSKVRHDARPKYRLKDGQLGLILATFHHSTSRPTALRPDPQEHRHCLYFKKGVTPDGKLQGLHNKFFYDNQKLFGLAFRKELAKCIREAGYETVPHLEKTLDENKNGRTIYTQAFAVKGITKEMRDTFSNRSLEIEKAAKDSGNTSNINKAWIAQNKKRGKQKWDEDLLISMWKDECTDLGLTKDYLDTLKTFSTDNFIKYMKSEHELIAESFVTHWKTKEKVLYEKNIMLKLYEYAQNNDINPEEYFKKLIESKFIERLEGYTYKCNHDLSHVLKIKRNLRNRISVNRKKVTEKFHDNFKNGKVKALVLDCIINKESVVDKKKAKKK